ncbi:MAG: MMPL family transporter [Planctomycetes bacterium]|nr:MMPL family transporter [Planctomycetota bacterium]
MIHWFGQHWAKVVLAAFLGALAAIVALYRPGLQEDYSIASIVGSDNAEFETFQEFIATFGGSELALIAVRGQNALDDDTLACLDEIVPQVEQLPAVRKVGAISKLPSFGRSLMLDHPLVRGVLVSHDGRTAAIILQMRGDHEPGPTRKQTVAELRRIVETARRNHAAQEIILTGPYVTMLEMFEFVREDLRLFSIGVAGLMCIVLFAVLGSWRMSFFAVGVAAAAVLCTLGCTIAAGVNMSLTTQMVVILIAVLAVATCVHLAVGLRESGGGVVLTLSNLMAPCTAVILTSVAAFASVCISDIQPIREFGVIMAGGLLLTLALAFAALFAVSRVHWRSSRQWHPGVRLYDTRAGLHRWLGSRLAGVAERSLRRRAIVIVLFGILAVLLAIPIPELQFESNFVKNFRADSTVRRGYAFISENLTPLGSIELVVRSKSGESIINVHAIQATDRVIAHAIDAHTPIIKGLSILDVLRLPGIGVPSSEVGLQASFQAAKAVLGKLLDPDLMRNFVTDDLSTLRISLRAREGAGVCQKIEMADDIRKQATMEFGPAYEVTVTGLYYFYATLMAGLLRDQNTTFAITLVAIFVISGLLLRSWKLAAIGMVPNLLPTVACLGLMGWLEIPINMATSMMLAISLGIAVDDTLHYLWRFRRELSHDGDIAGAILRTHRSVGLACVFTTVVITGGFWILCFSRFLPIAYFGVLIGLTMVVALAADLVLLPALLILIKPRIHNP